TPASPPSPLFQLVMQQALFYDGAEHQRVSRLIRAALASLLGLGGSLLAFLSTTVDQLLGDVLPQRQMDIVSDFAAPLTDWVKVLTDGVHLLLKADSCWRRLSAEVQTKPSVINRLVEHLLCLVTPTSYIAH